MEVLTVRNRYLVGLREFERNACRGLRSGAKEACHDRLWSVIPGARLAPCFAVWRSLLIALGF